MFDTNQKCFLHVQNTQILSNVNYSFYKWNMILTLMIRREEGLELMI